MKYRNYLAEFSIFALAASAALGTHAIGQDESDLAGDDHGQQAIESATPAVVMPGMEELVRGSLGLTRAEMQQLTIELRGAATIVNTSINGQSATIELAIHSMRDEQFRVLVPDENGELQEVEPPPLTTYRGMIREVPGAMVYASIINGQLRAGIDMPTGERWTIEPATQTVPGLPADWHVVYHTADMIDQGYRCGVEVMHADEDIAAAEAPPAIPDPAERAAIVAAAERGDDDEWLVENTDADESLMQFRPLAGAIAGRTQLGFDADFEFYQSNGSSVANVVADIEWLMNQVGAIYQNQVNICYAITGIIVRTGAADPYTQTAPQALLCEFTNEWNNNVADSSAGVPRDEAHLMTGKNLDSTWIGWAWGSSICDNLDASLCGASQIRQHGLSMLIGNQANRITLTAHELGHNWTGCHCDQSGCTGGGTDPDCNIMNSTINGSTIFGSRALSAITTYRDTRTCLATCFNPIYVDAGAGLIQSGSSVFPYDTMLEGEINAMVGGTIRAAGGTYPETLLIQKQLLIRKWVGTTGGVVVGD